MRHRLKVFATMFLLLYAITVSGQSTQQGVVLIRNVRVADGAGNPLVAADVLVVGGRVSRVSAGSPVPAGAIVIHGGGNRLTLGADGQIRLMPISSQSDATQPQVRDVQSQRVALLKEVPITDSVIPPGTRSLEVASQQAAAQDEENLAAKVVDPSSPLTTVTFQNKFTPSLWGRDDEQNEIDNQVAVPLELLGKRNILRITIPYLTSTPTGNSGLNDVSLFDIFLFPKKWGTGVAGVVASFGVNKGAGVDTFAIGPAVGVVLKKEKWTYGVFNQNLFSADDIATTQIQPILAYTFNKKVSVAFGDQQFTYDWHKDRFVLVPVGFQLNYIAMLGKQPVRFLIGPQYNIKNEPGAKKWTLTTGFALILR